jgi:2-polyprenyl-3-methyl-5-hydroxy-6-metoxy-1,4-benzoquinol methylase
MFFCCWNKKKLGLQEWDMHVHFDEKTINNHAGYSTVAPFSALLQNKLDTQNMPTPSAAKVPTAASSWQNKWGNYIDEYYSASKAFRIVNPTLNFVVGAIRITPDNGRILDFGAGWGKYAVAFAQAARASGKKIVVDALDQHADRMPALEEEYAQGLSINPIKMQFQDFHPEKNIYDVIYALNALFFLPVAEQKNVISELGHSLKPGGRLVFNLQEYKESTKKASDAHNYAPRYGMEYLDMKQTIEANGMRIMKVLNAREKNPETGEKVKDFTFNVKKYAQI